MTWGNVAVVVASIATAAYSQEQTKKSADEQKDEAKKQDMKAAKNAALLAREQRGAGSVQLLGASSSLGVGGSVGTGY